MSVLHRRAVEAAIWGQPIVMFDAPRGHQMTSLYVAWASRRYACRSASNITIG
jgi:hypothetical protein